MLLADFARTCKAAARAVSLYPGTHPAIGSSLSRLVASSGRLARHGPVKLAVHRELLAIDGRSPLRPDSSIGELATLLHERLIGRLTVQPGADAEDWRALLLLLARSPDDLMAAGGIHQAWTLTGRNHFEILEIDYAEVLRERGGGDDDGVGLFLEKDADMNELAGPEPGLGIGEGRFEADGSSSGVDRIVEKGDGAAGIGQ